MTCFRDRISSIVKRAITLRMISTGSSKKDMGKFVPVHEKDDVRNLIRYGHHNGKPCRFPLLST